jgi:hypothetical protein
MTDHMPTPPSVDIVNVATSRHHATDESMTESAAGVMGATGSAAMDRANPSIRQAALQQRP